jgi:type VI secretion system secreted protein VgrG
MPDYTQDGRKFRVESPLGTDVLLLERFTGEEAISTPYVFTLHMVSENPAIDPEALLRKPMVVSMELPDGTERHVHGLVRRFSQGTIDGPLTNYTAEVVPWLWFLSLGSDCRVFQNLSVPDIVMRVFKDLGFTDYRVVVHGSQEPREFCVQYRETHLAFVSRLLEEEGIFYFFEHTESGHTLVLTNSMSDVKPCPGQSAARMAAQAASWQHEDVVTGIVTERTARTGKIELRDYNYLTPSANLAAPIAGTAPEERYDYPGRYAQRDGGERYARLQLEAHEAEGFVVHGEGTCRAFQPGYHFELTEHYRDSLNDEYHLLRVAHDGTSGGFRAGRGADDADYVGRFEAIPFSVPYRPPRVTPRPIVHGSQTAVVVGPGGEEIWTDEHGRIKVQFHWDRVGRKDDKSSCWIRVAQPWAGKGWGSLAIPRIGQEVVVEFLEGDPDRPLVTGSVYNAEQTPPCNPGNGGVMSGLRSKTHKGSGYNEMTMDDTAGKEMITIHAQYDMSTTVEHDDTQSVGNNQSVSIGADRTKSVGKNETVSVGENRTEDVGKDETVSIGINQSLTVGKNQTIDVAENRSATIGKNDERTVGENGTVKVGKNSTTQVGKKYVLEAGDEIVLKTGSASITMKKDGTITIKGKDITVQGSGKVNVKASSDVVIKGSKVATN